MITNTLGIIGRWDVVRHSPYRHHALEVLASIDRSNSGIKEPALLPANLLSRAQLITEIRVYRGRKIRGKSAALSECLLPRWSWRCYRHFIRFLSTRTSACCLQNTAGLVCLLIRLLIMSPYGRVWLCFCASPFHAKSSWYRKAGYDEYRKECSMRQRVVVGFQYHALDI
jgi:hypothetical protein